MINDENEIRLKILAENEIRRIYNYMIPKIQERLRGCVGYKIIKRDGNFIKALGEELNGLLRIEKDKLILTPFREGDSAKIGYFYLMATDYSIYFKLQLCFSGGNYEDRTNYCFYWAKEYDVCRLDNAQVREFREFTPYKEINAEEQISQISKCREMFKQLNAEKEKITPYELRSYIG